MSTDVCYFQLSSNIMCFFTISSATEFPLSSGLEVSNVKGFVVIREFSEDYHFASIPA